MKTAPQRHFNSRKRQQELEWLYGTHPVLAALRHKRRKLVGLHLKDSGKDRLQAVAEAAKKSGVPIHYETPRWFSDNLGESVHQGVALQCGPLPLLDEVELPALNSGKPNLVFVLDGVEDPHNLGAIVRTLGFFGVGAVVIPKDRAAALSPVVAKASVGALEWFPVVSVTNLHRFLEGQKKRGYWVVGLDGASRNPLRQLAWDRPLMVVLGAEGSGLRPLTKRSCDWLVSIPGTPEVESLNVSNAAAVTCYHLRNTVSVPEFATPLQTAPAGHSSEFVS